jgi:GNAT superfamily N-acetyltransferase
MRPWRSARGGAPVAEPRAVPLGCAPVRYALAVEWVRADGFVISDATERLDRDTIHRWLVGAYWSYGLPRDVLDRSIAGSLCFGIYDPRGRQVGFCRVVSDMATVAWVCDVFVADDQRGRGLGVWLMEVVGAHPGLQGLRRWLLGTRDAHDLYRKTGYEVLTAEQAARYMARPTEADYGPGSAMEAPDTDRR